MRNEVFDKLVKLFVGLLKISNKTLTDEKAKTIIINVGEYLKDLQSKSL